MSDTILKNEIKKEMVEHLTQTILPFSIHGINPRTLMGKYKWDQIKKAKREEADHHCMICGDYVSHTPGNWLECHEVYNIDLDKKEFSIKGYISICKHCHLFIHQGYLRCLLADGTITSEEYSKILEKGFQLLSEFNLEIQDLPNSEIDNPDWYLLFEGKKYSNNK